MALRRSLTSTLADRSCLGLGLHLVAGPHRRWRACAFGRSHSARALVVWARDEHPRLALDEPRCGAACGPRRERWSVSAGHAAGGRPGLRPRRASAFLPGRRGRRSGSGLCAAPVGEHPADLRGLAKGEGSALRVEVAVEDSPDDSAPSTQAALYRLAQESITKVRRHARDASRVQVRVAGDGAWVLPVSPRGCSRHWLIPRHSQPPGSRSFHSPTARSRC